MTGARVRFLAPFAISVVLLVLVINAVRGEADELTAALGAADWRLIAPAIGLYFVGVWLRSARWRLLLPGHSIKTSTLFRALVVVSHVVQYALITGLGLVFFAREHLSPRDLAPAVAEPTA